MVLLLYWLTDEYFNIHVGFFHKESKLLLALFDNSDGRGNILPTEMFYAVCNYSNDIDPVVDVSVNTKMKICYPKESRKLFREQWKQWSNSTTTFQSFAHCHQKLIKYVTRKTEGECLPALYRIWLHIYKDVLYNIHFANLAAVVWGTYYFQFFGKFQQHSPGNW